MSKKKSSASFSQKNDEEELSEDNLGQVAGGKYVLTESPTPACKQRGLGLMRASISVTWILRLLLGSLLGRFGVVLSCIILKKKKFKRSVLK